MKRSKKLIAVTGGIGSGKSAVLEHLRGLGFAVLSADQNEFDIKQTALENSGRSYILADASKFGLTAMYRSDFLGHPGATLVTDNTDYAGHDRVIVVK